MYTFGEPDDGKLGLGEDQSAHEPTQVDISSKVTWVSCGGKHTTAVTGNTTPKSTTISVPSTTLLAIFMYYV